MNTIKENYNFNKEFKNNIIKYIIELLFTDFKDIQIEFQTFNKLKIVIDLPDEKNVIKLFINIECNNKLFFNETKESIYCCYSLVKNDKIIIAGFKNLIDLLNEIKKDYNISIK